MSLGQDTNTRIATEIQPAGFSSPACRALAIGDYVLGNTDLPTAARVAGTSPEELRAEIHDRAQHLAAEPPASSTLVSVVVPVFNNATTLRELHRRLEATLAPRGSFEIVLVDDGSTDGSAEVLRELCQADPRCRMLRLSRNFGQQAALTAGLDVARGAAVVLMDADLQDPPELLPDLIDRWAAGHEVVYLVRRNRKENLVKRLAYGGFYRMFRYLAEVDVPLDSGEFSLLDRKVVDALRAMPERNRFLRGLRSWSGFRQAGVEYDRPPRPSGESQYTWRRLLRLATDGLVGFSDLPLRLTAVLGLLTALAGLLLLLLLFVIVVRCSTLTLPVGWASSLSVVLLLGGVQLTSIGIVGAYIARIYAEVKKRPLYLVAERLG